jgi:hypothetical protein
MTTEKLVNKALFGKTELASVKVELGSVKELDSILSNGKDIISAIEKQGAILGKKLGEAITERRKFQDTVMSLKSLSYNVAKSSADDFKSKAKELGVDVANVSQLKEIEKLIAKTKEYEAFDKSIPTIPQV